jgi:hypothetical protein
MKYTLDEILASIDEMKKEITEYSKSSLGDDCRTSEEKKNMFIHLTAEQLYEIMGVDRRATIKIEGKDGPQGFDKPINELSQAKKDILREFLELEEDKRDVIFEKIDEMIKNLPSQKPSDQSHQSQKG